MSKDDVQARQAAREAAADEELRRLVTSGPFPACPPLRWMVDAVKPIRMGAHDDSASVQAFARFERATTEALRAENEALRAALERAVGWFEEYAVQNERKASKAFLDQTEQKSRREKALRNMDRAKCDQWQAAVEGEHPPCWSDGACWESNADEIGSLQPNAWRPLPTPPEQEQ